MLLPSIKLHLTQIFYNKVKFREKNLAEIFVECVLEEKKAQYMNNLL